MQLTDGLRKRELPLLLIWVSIGAFFRFQNIDGARFLDPDEYRSLGRLFPATPLLNFLYNPFVLFDGRTHSSALIATCIIGTVTLIPFWLLAKKLSDSLTAHLSTLLLALCGMHIFFSRSGYPIALQTLLILLVFLSLGSGFSSMISSTAKRYLLSFFAALSVLAYNPSYAFIASILGVGLLASDKEPRERRILEILMLSLTTLAFYLASLLAIVWVISGTINLGGFLFFIDRFQGQTRTFIEPGSWYSPVGFILDTYRRSGYFMTAVIIIGATGLMRSALSDNSTKREIAQITILSVAIFWLAGMCGLHTVYTRHFVWTLPLLVFYAVDLLHHRLGKYAIGILALLILLSIPAAFDVGQSQFKVSPITDWLKSMNIEKKSVATRMDIREPGDSSMQTILPLRPEGDSIVIDWASLSELVREEKVTHLLIPSLGSESGLGRNDTMLQQLTPLVAWPHPYRYRNPSDKITEDFKIYDLRSVIKQRAQ